jgi:ribosomal protein L11 methyltransferase
MNFIQLNVRCLPEFSEILVAELAELEFDSFEENKQGFSAYIEEEKIDFDLTKSLLEQYATLTSLSYGLQKIAKENWNKTWESNYEPIVIDDQILIKTPFHEISETYAHVITIIPKMSFGTGHHATTSQILALMLKFSPSNQTVIDAGSGTGILAIMAEKLGAVQVLGFDNDPWCIENGKENFGLNHCQKCEIVLASSIAELKADPVNVVLANINKNIILSELDSYSKHLETNGSLFLSGFYLEDVSDINIMAQSKGLTLIDQTSKDNWACLLYKKSN